MSAATVRWLFAILLFELLLPLVACSDSNTLRATRSLRGSDDVSVFCATRDDDGNLLGRPLSSCPDDDPDDGEARRMYSLVTQKETGEIALVNMGGCADAANCRGSVVDLEVTQPGTNFLPVGGEPISVVSTPGGMASFVAVAEPGREGIFALPTSCVGPRPEAALFRDLRTWPACRLPVAPGAMEVVSDRGRTTSCGGDESSTGGNRECPADLSKERLNPGRKKLLVALPSLGQLAVIDAQTLLDLPQGSFGDCPIENAFALSAESPDGPLQQQLPDEFAGVPQQCLPRGFEHPTQTQTFAPNPSDLALDGETLYVSDFEAPVVHVLDVRDPCQIRSLPPLLPRSFLDPDAVVTTRKVAVSPLTPSGKKFVYAIDDSPTETSGSIMIFDVSRESGQRTPLLRPRSADIYTEPPDRIQLDQEAADVEFVSHDFPAADPDTGVAVEGVPCNPASNASNSPGALYRSGGDDDTSAPSPSRLRGVFAMVALHSGLLMTIDVEDLDAECRRPKTINPEDDPDPYGCANDPYDAALTEDGSDDGTPTVSNESSCNISAPHRVRAGTFFDFQRGGTAPALRAFPQLTDRTGTSLPVDQSDTGRGHPRLLAVNGAPGDSDLGDAWVVVGTTRYENERDAPDRLILDPAESERNSVVLPLSEPRVYTGNLSYTVTYEGSVRPLSDGLLQVTGASELGLPDDDAARLEFSNYGVIRRGPNSNFCSSGLEDEVLIRDRGQALLSDPTEEALVQFAEQHADYVDLRSELLPSDDEYWDTENGRSCGERVRQASDGVTGHLLCELVFGDPTLPNLTREFRVERAFNDRLVVEPRRYASVSERRNILDLAECCFPQNVAFRIRAGQQWVARASGRLFHDVGTDPETFACIRDCNPLVAGQNSRIFELSCEGGDGCRVDDETAGVIGPPEFEEDERSLGPSRVCVLDQHPVGGVQPGGIGSECFFDALTARFAIYRGLLPSERDMTFSWRVLGGFTPLSVDLLRVASLQTTSAPQKLRYVPSINRLLVADGGSTGLLFIGLRRSDGGPGFVGNVAF